MASTPTTRPSWPTSRTSRCLARGTRCRERQLTAMTVRRTALVAVIVVAIAATGLFSGVLRTPSPASPAVAPVGAGTVEAFQAGFSPGDTAAAVRRLQAAVRDRPGDGRRL